LLASIFSGRHSAAKGATIDILERFGCGEDGWWLSPDFIERPKFVFFYFFFQIMYYLWYQSILSLDLAVPMYVCSVPLNAKIYSLSSPALYSADLALTMLWPQIRNNGLHHPPLMCLASKISYLNLTLTHPLANAHIYARISMIAYLYVYLYRISISHIYNFLNPYCILVT
jgi:hypothetical protein